MITTSSAQTWVFPEELQCGNSGCGQQALIRGRCLRHNAMWEIWEAFNIGFEGNKGDEQQYGDDAGGYLTLAHFLFCEGFPEFKDF